MSWRAGRFSSSILAVKSLSGSAASGGSMRAFLKDSVVATTESFKNARMLPPLAALPESDFTAKMLLENLPARQDIFYRVKFRGLSHTDIESEAVTGR